MRRRVSMKKNRLEIAVLLFGLIFIFLVSGCAGSGKNILPSPDSGERTGLPPADPYQPPAQQKAGGLSFILRTGWNAITLNLLTTPKKFTSVTMTYNGIVKVLKDASPAWTQSTIRYLKGRAWVLLQTDSTTASFQPLGKYYVYSAFNGVVLDFSRPFIGSLSPSYGPQGTEVTITGVNFGANQDTSTVNFNGEDAQVTSWSDLQIVCTVPAAGGTGGPVVVTAGGLLSNIMMFNPVAIYVKNGGYDGNDGLSWDTAKATIQAAVDVACTGSTILVGDGTYTGAKGNVAIVDYGDKNIEIKSLGGPSVCFLDGALLYQGIIISGGQSGACRLEGFTIRNCRTHTWNNGMGFMIQNNSNPTIVNCVLTDCSTGPGAVDFYGAGISCLDSSPTFTDCVIRNNICSASPGYGGAACCFFSSNPVFNNCLFYGNSATSMGGAFFCYGGANPVFNNCTLAGNTCGDGSAIKTWGSGAVLNNCIVWGNTISGSATVQYSDIEGGWGGTGNINSDPLFVGGADYRLQAGSSCIDTGNNDLISPGITTDLDGNPRIVNSIVDMGAYEKQ
jgi:hypothetical protein